MKAQHLRDYIVIPTLKYLGLWSQPAEDLLVGTAVHESLCGYYLRQRSGGPALGIYQMEPDTENDIWENYLNYRFDMSLLVAQLVASFPVNREEQLIGNLPYATAMARLKYFRALGPIPDTLEGQAAYWKEHYNTAKGAGTVDEYIDHYHRYVLEA